MFAKVDPPIIFALDLSKVRVNDVVLTSQGGLVPWGIRRITNSNFSHAALVTRPGSLIEAVMRGVVRRSIVGIWATRREWICVLRAPAGKLLQTPSGVTLGEIAEEGFANPYSLVGAVGTKFAIVRALRGQGQFCSELVAAAFLKCGHKIGASRVDSVTPEALRTAGNLQDVTDQCVMVLTTPCEMWRRAIDVANMEHPVEEARMLRRIFRALKVGLNYRLLPPELQSTPAILHWLFTLNLRQLGVPAADETISRVLEYQGYVTWHKKISGLIRNSTTEFAAVLDARISLKGTRYIWAGILQGASASLAVRAGQSQEFITIYQVTKMRTARVLSEMYKSIERDQRVFVTVLQQLVKAST